MIVEELAYKHRIIGELMQKYRVDQGIDPAIDDITAILSVRRYMFYRHITTLIKKGYLETIDGTRRSRYFSVDVLMKISRKGGA